MRRPTRLLLSLALLGALVPHAAAAAGALTEIRVYPGGASMYPGGFFGMGAVGVYEDGSTRDLSTKARFASDDETIAEIEKKNFLRARTAGVVQITASYRGLESAPVSFEVSPIVALEIIPAETGMRLGTTMFWGATATLANGAGGFAFSPFVSWSSDDDAVLPTEDAKKDRGVSVAAAVGTANLTATWNRTNGGPLTVTRPIAVVQTLSSVVVSPALRVIQRGDGARFKAVGTFEGGALADISFDVDWSSSDEAVVSPGSKGTLKVRGFGTTVLSVVDRDTMIGSAPGGNATLTIVGEVLSLTMEPPALALLVGEDERLDAIATVEENASTFSWGGRVVWTSSDSAVASVNDDGDVTCLDAGAATITAREPRSDETANATVTCS